MSDLLQVRDLQVHFGGIRAVDGISLDVEQGKIVTLIGANGAGKSTILRCTAGIVHPQGGEILFEGENILGMSPDKIVSRGITLVPEGRRVFPNLTVLENLRVGAYLRKDDLTEDLEYVYSLFPRLKERHWQLAGTLSGGEQQMLAMGRAMMCHPRLLMLDEPSMGLSPLLVDEVFDIIKDFRDSGTTILLVEQNANKALNICDRAYVLENGKLVLTGTGAELLASEEVKKAYLGG